MKKLIKLSVYDITGKPLCVSADDGHRVYEKIASLLQEDYKVIVSFTEVELLTPTFLNAAIGQLYGDFTSEHIRHSISIGGMEQEDLAILRQVVDNAKVYFDNNPRP